MLSILCFLGRKGEMSVSSIDNFNLHLYPGSFIFTHHLSILSFNSIYFDEIGGKCH